MNTLLLVVFVIVVAIGMLVIGFCLASEFFGFFMGVAEDHQFIVFFNPETESIIEFGEAFELTKPYLVKEIRDIILDKVKKLRMETEED